MDKEYRRCSICDYFEGGDINDRRKFILDTPTQEHHCERCMNVIRDDLGYNYWQEKPRAKGGEAFRKAMERRGTGGASTLQTPLSDAFLGPSEADLEAIESEWEELLRDMELGNLDEYE